jgi:hypothetical protein
MKLTTQEAHDLRRFAVHLLRCADSGDVPEDTVHALNAVASAAPRKRTATNADDPAFLPPVPYFKTSTK